MGPELRSGGVAPDPVLSLSDGHSQSRKGQKESSRWFQLGHQEVGRWEDGFGQTVILCPGALWVLPIPQSGPWLSTSPVCSCPQRPSNMVLLNSARIGSLACYQAPRRAHQMSRVHGTGASRPPVLQGAVCTAMPSCPALLLKPRSSSL